jgi:hypothetical protein
MTRKQKCPVSSESMEGMDPASSTYSPSGQIPRLSTIVLGAALMPRTGEPTRRSWLLVPGVQMSPYGDAVSNEDGHAGNR